MSTGRTEVNGTFQLSTYTEPTATETANQPVSTCEVVAGRGKGAVTITFHTDTGAQISSVVQLSTDVEKTLSMIVSRANGPLDLENQANTAVDGNDTMVTVNILTTAVITKFDVDIQGKLESARIGDTNDIKVAAYITQSATLFPAGYQKAYSTVFDEVQNSKTNRNGENAGKVETSAPGRGHLGVVRSL